jgi:hypothetical protein
MLLFSYDSPNRCKMESVRGKKVSGGMIIISGSGGGGGGGGHEPQPEKIAVTSITKITVEMCLFFMKFTLYQ